MAFKQSKNVSQWCEIPLGPDPRLEEVGAGLQCRARRTLAESGRSEEKNCADGENGEGKIMI